MKRIDTSFATGPVGLPIKTGSLNLLQDNVKELAAALIQSFTGVAPLGVQVLYGCINTGSTPAVNISAGAVLYNGEIYFVDAAAFTPSNTVIAVTEITYITSASADPVTHTDSSAHNVHQVRKIKIIDGLNTNPDYVADYADFTFLTNAGDDSRAMVSGDIQSVASGTATFSSGQFNWRVHGKQVFVNFSLSWTQTGGATAYIRLKLPINWGMLSVAFYNTGFDSVGNYPLAITTGIVSGPVAVMTINRVDGSTFANGSHTINGQITFMIA